MRLSGNKPAELASAVDIIAKAEPRRRVRCGIYFLICRGAIVYVGRAIDINRRLLEHEQKEYDAVTWVPCPARQQKVLEREYLDKFLPRLNRDLITQIGRHAAAPFWRGNTLWGRAMIDGILVRKSMRTSDPKEAMFRREAWKASHKPQRLFSPNGDTDRTTGDTENRYT
jgi:hypothetical protein